MKRYYLFSVTGLLLSMLIYAQEPEFWGMTALGGNDFGVVFKTDGKGENFRAVQVFAENPGRHPSVKLVQATNGKLYGVNKNGGVYGDGILFEYDILTNTTTKIIDFYEYTIGSSSRQLIQAANGKIYGIANGGANGDGTIYEYDLSADTTRKVMDFKRAISGRSPYIGFSEASNGKLYATAFAGGLYDLGVIFEFDPNGNVFTKLYDLKDSLMGEGPVSIMQASSGKFYGVTSRGGVNDVGVLFEYDLSSNKYTKLLDFSQLNQQKPFERLTQGLNGKLYGVTVRGGANNTGILYEYDPGTDTLIKITDFGPTTHGHIASELLLASNGKLYGTTSVGGADDQGILYEYDPVNKAFQVKIDFYYSNRQGNTPWGLIEASNGKIYGVCSGGGDIYRNEGVLFEYDISTGNYTKKLQFWDDTEGGSPYGSLIRASSNGKLYGLGSAGGAYDRGVLFEIDPLTEVYSIRHSFGGPGGEGAGIRYTLVEARNGKLYGTTVSGGSGNKGIIFSYEPVSGTYEKEMDFGGELGESPRGNMVLASNGKLYGMTESRSGFVGNGVIYEFDPLTKIYTKLHEFDNIDPSNGFDPQGELIEAEEGRLLGMAMGGIHDAGVLFEYNLHTNTFTKKIDFPGYVGKDPMGGLVKAPNGKFYGLANAGGTNYMGTLFEYDMATNELTRKVDFDDTLHGAGPKGSLIRASNGKLYGLTSAGGVHGKGVLFEYDPNTDIYVKKYEFDGWYGERPEGSLLELYSKYVAVEEQQEETSYLSIYPNPSQKIAWLELGETLQNGRLEVNNLHGQVVLEKHFGPVQQLQINIETWPAGVYLLKVNSEKGVWTNRLIKR